MVAEAPVLLDSPPAAYSHIPGQTQTQAISAFGPNTRAPPTTQHTTPSLSPALPSQSQQPTSLRPRPTTGANGATVPSAVTEPPSSNTPTGAPSLATTGTPPLCPYRDPEPLVGYQGRPVINKYPHALLSAVHSERATHVVNAFRDAIVTSKVRKRFPPTYLRDFYLRDFNNLITFEVCICGPSARDSKPSILAFCPKKIYQMLRKQLQLGNVPHQYAADVTPGPSFELYYCFREVPYVLTWCSYAVRLSSSADRDVWGRLGNPSNSLTMCGTRVHSVENGQYTTPGFATLACLLEIKGDLFSLTSAHPFRHHDDVSLREKLFEQLQEIPDDDDEECEIILEDDEDGELTFDGKVCTEDSVEETKHLPTGKLLFGETDVDESSTDLQDLKESIAIFPGPDDLGSDKSDRDWAVTPIKRADQQLPNAYSVNQNSFHLRYLTEIACEHPLAIERSTNYKQPTTDLPVHILTSSSIKYGTLTPGFANLAGLSGRGSCEVWIISMKDSAAIIKGDSGSLVVDASTSRVYGHIVAISPLGDAYVVPMHDTFQQIKAFFETTDVQLPDPLRLLTEVSLFYLEAEQPKLAKTAIMALADLVQQLCDARKWRQLSHWAATSATRNTLLSHLDEKLAEIFPEFKTRPHIIREPLMVKHILRQRLLAERPKVDSWSLHTIREDFSSFFYSLFPQIILEGRYLSGSTGFPYNFASNHLPLARGLTDLTTESARLFHTYYSLLTDPSCRRIAWEIQGLKVSNTLRSQPHFLPSVNRGITTCSMDTHVSLSRILHADCKSPGHALYKDLLGSSERLADGGFATVYRVTVPETHRAIWSTNGQMQIALKMISKRTTPLTRWLNEKRILKQLQQFNHPNIIKLLDSFCVEDNYLLLFPLATCDLDSLMTFNPPASQNLTIWALKQMQGLAKALEYVHTGDERHKWYGRHGDLKPANILFFNQDKSFDLGNETTSGNLVIADFGLSQFHRKKSARYGRHIDNDYPPCYGSRADRQYAPPEVEVPMNSCTANRSYDIWSFGCIVLELLVWMIAGAESRRQLLKELHSDAPGHPASYWHIEMTTQSLEFSLKPQVSTWLELLLERTENNAMLRATIDLLVYGGLLDPDPNIRPTAKELGLMLVEIETRMAFDRKNTTDAPPVWKRLWIRQNVHSNWSGSPLLRLEAPADKGGYMTPTAAMLLERKEEISQSSGSTTDSVDEHGEEPPLKQKCPYCEAVGRPVAIKYHVRSQHRNDHPQECPRCGHLFADHKQLARHLQGPNLYVPHAVSLAALIAEDLDRKNALQELSLLSPPAPSIDKDKPDTEDGGTELDQPAHSASYSSSCPSTDKSTPVSGAAKMGSVAVRIYHPDDDPSKGSHPSRQQYNLRDDTQYMTVTRPPRHDYSRLENTINHLALRTGSNSSYRIPRASPHDEDAGCYLFGTSLSAPHANQTHSGTSYAQQILHQAPRYAYSEPYNAVGYIKRDGRVYDEAEVYEEYEQVGKLDENTSDDCTNFRDWLNSD